MTTPFPRIEIPAWPIDHEGLSSDQLNKHHQTELAFASLEPLGFSLLMGGECVSLENRLRDLVDEVSAARPGIPRSKSWKQWWFHPAGIVAFVDRYETQSRGWFFNGLSFLAEVRNPSGFNESQFFQLDAAGEPLDTVHFSSDYKNGWDRIVEAAQAGCLIPFDQWTYPRWGNVNVSATLSLLSIHDDLIRIDRTSVSPSSPRTPAEISKLNDKLHHQNVRLIGRAARTQVDALDVSEADRATWLRLLAAGVVRYATPAELFGRKNALKNMRHKSAGLALQYAIKDLAPNAQVFLSKEERAITAQWLSVLNDRRHPRLQERALRKAMSSSIPRLGLSFHHLLFGALKLPGAPAKALWWQSQQSDETLSKMCQVPEKDGKTLPMRWAESWMFVPNERVNPRHQRLRAGVAQHALEDLMLRVSPAQLAWSTDSSSIWGGLVNPGFNVEKDDDLAAAHRVAVKGFLGWSSARALDLPSVVFFPGSPVPHDLFDADGLRVAASAWFTRENVFFPPRAQALVDSMDPVCAYLLSARLDQTTPRALSVRRPGTRL